MILVGKAGSGKSTIAELLGYDEYCFGSAVKDTYALLKEYGFESAYDYLWSLNGCVEFNDKDKAFIEDTLKDLEFYTSQETKPRKALQVIGQMMRHVDKDFWIKALKKKLWGLESDRRVVISDCRFKNEFYAFNQFTVYIECSAEERVRRLKKRDGCSHKECLSDISETELQVLKPQCDYVLDTTGLSYEQLVNAVEKLKVEYRRYREKNIESIT